MIVMYNNHRLHCESYRQEEISVRWERELFYLKRDILKVQINIDINFKEILKIKHLNSEEFLFYFIFKKKKSSGKNTEYYLIEYDFFDEISVGDMPKDGGIVLEDEKINNLEIYSKIVLGENRYSCKIKKLPIDNYGYELNERIFQGVTHIVYFPFVVAEIKGDSLIDKEGNAFSILKAHKVGKITHFQSQVCVRRKA